METKLFSDKRLSVRSFSVGSELRRSIKRSGKIQNVICHEAICFFIADNKVLVSNGMQTFLLEPVEVPGNLWQRRVDKIRGLALKRRIQSFEELIKECGRGVRLVYTELDWYV